ncbi:MAG: cytochrome bc complex cytochrome b subunit [Acidobacteriaceae bacterium]
MITKRISRWVDSRVHAAKFVRKALNHVFPDHWSFMLGEIALYSFMILVATGIYLVFFFHASSQKVIYHGSYQPLVGEKVSVAYQSVLHISMDVRAGLLIRQMHHWAALIFLWAILAHLARIYFTGAYRKPREMNWLIGLTLLVLALVNGFMGYSMLDDLLSGTGLRIGYGILLSVPVLGPWLTFLFMGGVIPNPEMIPRIYAMHIFVVPALIAALLALHLGMIWRQLHTNYPGPKRTDTTIVGSRLWPSYTAKSVGLLLLVTSVVAALGGLVQIDPVWLYGPYEPGAVMAGAQPDWYLGWVEGAMRLFPGINLRLGHWLVPELFFPAILLPSAVFVLLYMVPFIERFITGDKEEHNVLLLPYEQPVRTALGVGLVVFMFVLLTAGGDDIIAVATGWSVVELRTILRFAVLLVPPMAAVLAYLICIRMQSRKAAQTAALEIQAPPTQEEDPACVADTELLLPSRASGFLEESNVLMSSEASPESPADVGRPRALARQSLETE